MGKVPVQIPSVTDLIESADAGRFDDRLDEYLPDEFFVSRGAQATRAKRVASARRTFSRAKAPAALRASHSPQAP